MSALIQCSSGRRALQVHMQVIQNIEPMPTRNGGLLADNAPGSIVVGAVVVDVATVAIEIVAAEGIV